MIITVDKFKEFVDVKEPDEIIEAKLTALESLIRKYTNNNFQVRSIRSQSAILDGKILNPPAFLKPGDSIHITESMLNNGVYEVVSIDENGMSVSKDLLDCRRNLVTKIEYPPDVVMGVVNMLKWDLQNRNKIGIQSETI